MIAVTSRDVYEGSISVSSGIHSAMCVRLVLSNSNSAKSFKGLKELVAIVWAQLKNSLKIDTEIHVMVTNS